MRPCMSARRPAHPLALHPSFRAVIAAAPIQPSMKPSPRPASPAKTETKRIYEVCEQLERVYETLRHDPDEYSQILYPPVFIFGGQTARDGDSRFCEQLAKLGCRGLAKQCATVPANDQERAECRNFLLRLRNKNVCK